MKYFLTLVVGLVLGMAAGWVSHDQYLKYQANKACQVDKCCTPKAK